MDDELAAGSFFVVLEPLLEAASDEALLVSEELLSDEAADELEELREEPLRLSVL